MKTDVLQYVNPAKWMEHLYGLTPERWNSLKGKSFWVTGAGTGYGCCIACALAAAGAQVFLTGRRVEKLKESIEEIAVMGISTKDCHVVEADITKYDDILMACNKVKTLCSSLNGIVNNAAISGNTGSPNPFQNASLEYWNKVMATNVTAPWLLTREIFPHMLAGHSVRILFITSEAGWASTHGVGIYNVSKAALNSLCHSMAQEYGCRFPDKDIQINAIVAGEARTEMNQGSIQSPYTICSIVLILLSHPKGGPNGRFFHMDGRHFQFCYTAPYDKPLIEIVGSINKVNTEKPTISSIYPIEIPEIKFLPDQDFILLQLPMRYMPMMPNGVGYVHNILKQIGIHFQTVDLNIRFYHRYHSKRILDRLDKVVTSSGYVMPDDLWDNTNIHEWNKPEVIEYFRPEINGIINGLIKAHPKIIGVSLNGTNLLIAQEVVKGVRKVLSDVIIVVGGYDCVYPDVGPRKFLEFDYMVIGEAEMTFGPLVKALLAGERPKDMPGVISRYDSPDRIWVPGSLLQDLDSIDFPRYEWTDINLYRTYTDERSVPIVANRGCRWSKCRFCCECFPWRKRGSKKVVDEIEWMVGQGLRSFHFNDSDFNCGPDVVFEMCDEIIRRRLEITFSAAGFRIDRHNTREFFDHLYAAGFTSLQFGVDGWTNHVLRLQNKGYTMKIVEQNLRNCYKAGIHVSVNIVIGVPGETEEDVKESIDNILKNGKYIDVFGTIEPLILGHGSEYYKNLERYNIHFRGDKEEIYGKYIEAIPSELWYSTEPYIDHETRLNRLKTICTALYENGINIGAYARKRIENMVKGFYIPFIEKVYKIPFIEEGYKLYTLGSSYERLGSLEKARESFEAVISLTDKLPSSRDKNRLAGGAYFHLGCIYPRMGEKEKAKYHLKECLRFILNHRKAKENLEKLSKS